MKIVTCVLIVMFCQSVLATNQNQHWHNSYFTNPVSISNIHDMLSFTAEGSGSCDEMSGLMTPAIYQQTLIVYAGSDASICESETYMIPDAMVTGYSSFEWNTSGDGNFNNLNILSPIYTPGKGDLSSGSVILSLTATNTGNSDSITDNMVLTIYPTPKAYAGENTTIYKTDSYILSDATAENYSSLVWSTMGTGLFDDPAALNPKYTPSAGDIADGYVVLTITAKGNASCGETIDEIMLTIDGLPLGYNIVIYNGITPNGDGLNERWIIDGIEQYPYNEVFLFNRWGNIFREYKGYDNENIYWDGTNQNGVKMPDGTYYYIIKIQHDGLLSEYKGWVYVHD